jgi:muconolactone D-isomerase
LSDTTGIEAGQSKEAPVEFLTTMTTHVPEGTLEKEVDSTKEREAVRARELAALGHLLRLWRPPVRPGEWKTLGLWSAENESQLQELLASMPLHVWMTVEVTPLMPHPNDPGIATT